MGWGGHDFRATTGTTMSAGRSKPHVRIHHSVQNHPRTVALYADNDLLAAWLRIMVTASERGAAHTGDWLALSPADVERTSGRRRADVARTLLERLANVLGWSVERSDNVLRIQVRNFGKKQGIAPRVPRSEPRTTRNSATPPVPVPDPTPRKEYSTVRSLNSAEPTNGQKKPGSEREACVRLLVRDIVEATGDEQDRGVRFFVRVASVLPEPIVRRLIAEVRAEASGGKVRNPAAYFTTIAKAEMAKGGGA